MKKSQNNLTDAEILRQKAEEQLKKQQSKVSSFSSENDLRKLAHELQVHQIELGIQYEQLKQAKEEADAATQKYTELYDFAPSGFFTLSKLGEIIGLNLHGASLLGKERLRLINRRFGSSVSDQTKSIFNHFLDKVFTSKGNQSCEVTLSVESKNIPTYVYLTGNVLENGEQCLISVVDITERKRAEEELRESEEKHRTILQTAMAGFWMVDMQGRLLEVNETYCKMSGYSAQELMALRISNLEAAELAARSAARIQKIKSQGEDRFETQHYRKDGSIFDVEVSAKYQNVEDGRFVVFIQDISERKIAEQELIIAKEHAEQSDRLKSAFLANMSHEIRTPMNGILGFAGLLKKPDLTGEQQQEYISIIVKSGARMLDIINDIVDISKIESGLMKVNVKESNVNEQIEYIYTFFKPEVEGKGMQLFFKNSLPLKEAILKTDREKVSAILINLVKNAIKFSDKGSIGLGYEKKGKYLEYFVKDTGIGIPKDRQKAIFDRFVQADIADKHAYQGAGLGLSISKAYVEMLGGRIWVESEEGKGSTFYFTLLYNTEPEEKTVVENIVKADVEENQMKKLKILIAEDDESSDKFISIVVRKFGKEIINVATGTKAVEVCRNNPDIDLVLMDIQMPDMDGYEATRQIRLFNKDVVIIAQTAFALTGDREKAIEAGCNDYISKPIKKDELMVLVQKHFKKQETLGNAHGAR